MNIKMGSWKTITQEMFIDPLVYIIGIFNTLTKWAQINLLKTGS